MVIAMNRFGVRHGEADRFETVWRTRETRLTERPGFRSFHLLRDPTPDDQTLFASPTAWASRDAFRSAHRDAGDHQGYYLGRPEFEGRAAGDAGVLNGIILHWRRIGC
jgi:heme-degrading monooxygenase HmoA